MRIRIISICSRMPTWVTKGYHEYSKRLNKTIDLELKEIPLERRSNGNNERQRKKEADKMLSAIGKTDHVIALAINKRQWSTEQLSDKLSSWLHNGSHISLLIGGPEGLHASCLDHAHDYWSLSALTLPHALVRIVVAEQIYRAQSLLYNHPYHK